MSRLAWRRLFILCVVAPLINVTAFAAWAELRLAPTRAVLTEERRSAVIRLHAPGPEGLRLRVYFIDLRQRDDGSYESRVRPEAKQAEALLRASPRAVDLAPGDMADVRLYFRPGVDVPPGEYRTHLAFAAEPAAPAESSQPRKDRVDVQIAIVPVVSIPVIVRVGDLRATAAIENARIERRDGAPRQVVLHLVRDGTASLYGDLVVVAQGADGETVELGRRSGVAAFTENRRLALSAPLSLPEGRSVAPGSLRVLFVERGDDGAPDRILAESKVDE